MKRKSMMLLIGLAVVALAGTVMAQGQQPAPPPQAASVPAAPIAGVASQVVGVTVDEMTLVAKGWSANKMILGQALYNDKNENLGMIFDLIIAPDKVVSYALVAAGGFIGIDTHNVAIPMSQIKIQEGKMLLPGATQEAVKAMPPFHYTP